MRRGRRERRLLRETLHTGLGRGGDAKKNLHVCFNPVLRPGSVTKIETRPGEKRSGTLPNRGKEGRCSDAPTAVGGWIQGVQDHQRHRDGYNTHTLFFPRFLLLLRRLSSASHPIPGPLYCSTPPSSPAARRDVWITDKKEEEEEAADASPSDRMA